MKKKQAKILKLKAANYLREKILLLELLGQSIFSSVSTTTVILHPGGHKPNRMFK